ncbi:MAG: hypothetical protein IBX36_02430 [Dehalococcoidia bacterium]|nr:hypothetical protein [Dehalococcoidia bacterium]
MSYKLMGEAFESFDEAVGEWLWRYGARGGCVGIEDAFRAVRSKTREEWVAEVRTMIDTPLCCMGRCGGTFAKNHATVAKAILEDIKDID